MRCDEAFEVVPGSDFFSPYPHAPGLKDSPISFWGPSFTTDSNIKLKIPETDFTEAAGVGHKTSFKTSFLAGGRVRLVG